MSSKNNEHVLKSQDAPTEVLLVDPVTLPIARKLASLNVHPLTITAFAFIFRMAGAVLFATNYLAVGAVASIIGFYLDGIDGKIARLRKLDQELHGTVDFLLDQVAFAAMGIGALIWSLNHGNHLMSILICSWVAFYMILMAFTSTWFRLLSQRQQAYEIGTHHKVFKDTINRNSKSFIATILLGLEKVFVTSKEKLAKYRMIPYFGAIESELMIFMIAPFVNFHWITLLLAVIFLLPDIFITFGLCIMMALRSRNK